MIGMGMLDPPCHVWYDQIFVAQGVIIAQESMNNKSLNIVDRPLSRGKSEVLYGKRNLLLLLYGDLRDSCLIDP